MGHELSNYEYKTKAGIIRPLICNPHPYIGDLEDE
jgi:hypothetical protein